MPSRAASRTYGTVSADRRKEMSGLEFVQGLADGTLPLNTIARTLGYDVTEAASGRVVVTAEPSDDHLNPAGTVHGGFRPRCSIAAWGWRSSRRWKRASARRRWSSRYRWCGRLRRRPAEIRAEGIVLSSGRRVGTAEGRITDSKGRLLAHGTTTCLIFEN